MLCIAFTIVPFLPCTNIFFAVGFVIAERNLYLSSVGFVGIVALGAVVVCQNKLTRKVSFQMQALKNTKFMVIGWGWCIL